MVCLAHLRLDEFIRYYIEHQIEVIVRRTKFRLAEKEKRAHILAGLPQGT
jgi:DNA gyrase subunit A